MRQRAVLVLAFAPTILGACASENNAWGRRGGHWVLHNSATLQIRRGRQRIDPATQEVVSAWIGARALEGQPPLLGCELDLFDDKNGNRKPDPGEVLSSTESLERTSKVLFSDVRVLPAPGRRLRARLVARTESEICEVSWVMDED